MRKSKYLLIITITTLLFLSLIAGSSGEFSHKIINEETQEKYNYYDNPQVCLGCHFEKFDTWKRSQMSRAFTGDFFQAQYYKLAVVDAGRDEKVKGLTAGCIGCHSPSAYKAGDFPPSRAGINKIDSYWQQKGGIKLFANRGVFCDFCHTIEDFKGTKPFNHNYVSRATPGIDPKRGDLEFPWSPYHKTARSELHEDAQFCGICHNELNDFGVWVKATEIEYQEGPYPAKQIACQDCHMPPIAGKPAKMGPARLAHHDHWFGGGFETFVQGAAKITINIEKTGLNPGEKVNFSIKIHHLAPGHKFPTGASEERDVWLHVGIYDEEGNELDHIKIPGNPGDPNDKYFITTNEKVAYPTHSRYGNPIERDSLPEGDRLYHTALLDSDGHFTFAQWYGAKEIENRLKPLEERIEKYTWKVPGNLIGKTVILRAVLSYRRMPDSYAKYLGIPTRPRIEVSRDERILKISP
ncbi:MAG: ammonia-forming cytochrome c nitrite reductase subunit c552 [Candidatus Aminicenantes bacterium]|nr:MAG: ammonia-forming cytochrome c nitrite reductase subunit c552 [Candidatus Aminicenantes bacterium]